MKPQDRKALIRLASSLPKGSEERKAILTGLQKQGADLNDPVVKLRNIGLKPDVVFEVDLREDYFDEDLTAARKGDKEAIERFRKLGVDWTDEWPSPSWRDLEKALKKFLGVPHLTAISRNQPYRYGFPVSSLDEVKDVARRLKNRLDRPGRIGDVMPVAYYFEVGDFRFQPNGWKGGESFPLEKWLRGKK